MKLRIIDLINKIANNEELPKKIKYDDVIWDYDYTIGDYINKDKVKALIESLFWGNSTFSFINEEVEIIKENKNIEKITIREKTIGFPNGEWTARNMDKAFAHKINEIIDEINKLKE